MRLFCVGAMNIKKQSFVIQSKIGRVVPVITAPPVGVNW